MAGADMEAVAAMTRRRIWGSSACWPPLPPVEAAFWQAVGFAIGVDHGLGVALIGDSGVRGYLFIVSLLIHCPYA
jgi:hypothetical protein